jgi:hypothetical protein
VAGLFKIRANHVVRGRDRGNCAAVVQNHYSEAMSETSPATEEVEPPGQHVPREDWVKVIASKRGKTRAVIYRIILSQAAFCKRIIFGFF